MNGWISLHRKIRQNPVFYDLQLLRLWLICLMEASHKEHKILVGKQSVDLRVGQFVTGRFELGMKYNEGLKPKDRVQDITVWRWLKTLEELEFMIIESNNKFSLCTVVKWQEYQNNDQQNDQQMINKRSANDQQKITNNNGNKGDNVNKGNKKTSREKRIFTDEDTEYKISSYLFEKIVTINPNAKQPDLQKWSNTVRLMFEQDNRKLDEVRDVVRWLYSEPEGFWKTVILSTDNLRKKFDQVNTKRLNSTSISKPIGNYTKETKFDKNKALLLGGMNIGQNGSRNVVAESFGSLPESSGANRRNGERLE